MRRGRFQFVRVKGMNIELMIPGPPAPQQFRLTMDGGWILRQWIERIGIERVDMKWQEVRDPEIVKAALAAVTDNHKIKILTVAIERARR